MQYFIQFAVQRFKWSNDLLPFAEFLNPAFQILLLILHFHIVTVCHAYNFEHLLQAERLIWFDLVRILKISGKLYGLVQGIPVRVDLYKRL